MSCQQICPHCGAEKDLNLNRDGDVVYGCGAIQFSGRSYVIRNALCMGRQIAAQAETIDRLKKEISTLKRVMDGCVQCFDNLRWEEE